MAGKTTPGLQRSLTPRWLSGVVVGPSVVRLEEAPGGPRSQA